MANRRSPRHQQQCCRWHCQCGWIYPRYAQGPAEIIRRVLALARFPRSSRGYRRLMTYIEPRCSPVLTHLAAAVDRDMGGRP